ncbi:MAG: NYN domain-containing protein [Candidatus Dependentiae bacterium]|jgi:predicted RNA-binding protein with PIN domain
MIIFIDAYNALRFLFPQDRDSTQAQRAHFLQQLSAYVSVKKHDGIEVRVVFDGGMMPHRHREVHGGVVIMEAGYGYDADSYIVECVQRHDSEVLVVTNDRELQRFCIEEGAQVMKVVEFWDAVRDVVMDASPPQEPGARSWIPGQAREDIIKHTDDTNPDLDSLMIEASLGAIPHKEDGDDDSAERTSHGRKLSKKAKRRERLQKKIR